MSPTIQLIQLTLKIEREAEKQRRPSTVYRDDLASEKRTAHASETVVSSASSACFSPTAVQVHNREETRSRSAELKPQAGSLGWIGTSFSCGSKGDHD